MSFGVSTKEERQHGEKFRVLWHLSLTFPGTICTPMVKTSIQKQDTFRRDETCWWLARCLSLMQNVNTLQTTTLTKKSAVKELRIISPLILHNRFLCCTAYNRMRLIVQLRPHYGRANLFGVSVDISNIRKDDVLLSEPTETPVPKLIRTEKRIA